MGKSRHSAFSVKRYMCSFSNILLLVSHEMVDVKEISRLLGQSEHLAEEGFQYHGDGESNGHGSEYSYTVSYFYIIISS